MLDSRVSRLLGSLEADIMAILWSVPQTSVRRVTERLNVTRPKRPLAYTTVMTVMSRLSEKGLLTRTLVGKTYVYRPARTQDDFLSRLSNERVVALVEEFGELALAQFLSQLDQLDPDHLRRLIELARQRGSEEDG